MSRKKPKYQKKPFESTGERSDVSANLYASMLTAPAWKCLSAKQQKLYIYCKLQLYAEKNKPNGDPLCFTMNQAKWSDFYGLYKRNNAAAFYRDMEALIRRGFVSCVECGAISRTKSVYRFSSMWQNWGTDSFKVTANDMTVAMLRKDRKSTT